MKNNFLAITRGAIPYIKELRPKCGSVTACILMQQLDYWFDKYPDGFYKFKAPCNHTRYKIGDSWAEELGFSDEEFMVAFSKIGVAHSSKTQYRLAEDKFLSKPKDLEKEMPSIKFYCSYFDRVEGLTHYFRNHDAVDEFLCTLSVNRQTRIPSKPTNTDSVNRQTRIIETDKHGFSTYSTETKSEITLQKGSSPIGAATEKAMLETNEKTLSFSLSEKADEKTSSSIPVLLSTSQGGAAASCKIDTKSATPPAASKPQKVKTEKQVTERTHLHQPFIDLFNTFIDEKQKDNSMWEGFNWGNIDLRGIKDLRLIFVKRANNCAIKAGKETASDMDIMEKFSKFIVYAWDKSDAFNRRKFSPDYLCRKFNEFTGEAVEVKKPQAKHQRPVIADFSLPENQFTSFT